MTSYNIQFEELKNIIQEYNPCCLCLQETRQCNRQLNPPSGYKIVQPPLNTSNLPNNDDAPQKRGVALLIRKNINYRNITLSIPNNIEAIAAQIYAGKYYTVCSMYLSPSTSIEKRDVLNVLEQLPKPYLVLGDMNARHTSWGEDICNAKGDMFEQLLIEENL